MNISPGLIQKKVKVPNSKSWANRYLVRGAYLGKGSLVQNLPHSTDVEDLLNCFSQLGLSFVKKGQDVLFHESFLETHTKKTEIETGEGGTTNRFLIPLLLRRPESFVLKPHQRFLSRPQDFTHLHGRVEVGNEHILLKKGDPIEVKSVDCSITTQNLSGIWLTQESLALTEAVNLRSSLRYLDMTKKVVAQTSPFKVPRDSSSLAYPLILNYLGCKIDIENEGARDSFQADDQIYEVLDTWEKQEIIDCTLYPDLIMPLVFLASYTPGKKTFINLDILKGKESNRLEQSLYLLRAFEIPFELNDLLVVGEGTPLKNSKELKMSFDHRSVMTATLYLWKNAGGHLSPTQAVTKSFPNFFTLFL